MAIETRSFELVKSQTGNKGKFIYTVADENGKEIYKSAPTHRDYVAIVGRKEGHAEYRFGRIDLIGKGDSSLYWDAGYFNWFAIMPELSKLVKPLPRKQLYHFYFDYKGHNAYGRATSEDGAKLSAIKYLKRHKRISGVQPRSLKFISKIEE